MRYLYYPGCALKGTGRAYEESLLATFAALDVTLEELADWNCCGATAYMSIDDMKSYALGARNLALAERQNGGAPTSLVAPCAGCYLVLTKTQHYLEEYSQVSQTIDAALQAAGLRYTRGGVHVRHPLDVLVRDLGTEAVAGKVKRPLTGMKVACYYGCQIVRPYAAFDDQVNPTAMDRLLRALGAETVDWPLKTHCCGGSLMGTAQDIALELNYHLLLEALKRGADAVATACPLCQFNLECYQDRMSARHGEKLRMPVAYFTQLTGLALGIPAKSLGLSRNFIPLEPALARKERERYVHA